MTRDQNQFSGSGLSGRSSGSGLSGSGVSGRSSGCGLSVSGSCVSGSDLLGSGCGLSSSGCGVSGGSSGEYSLVADSRLVDTVLWWTGVLVSTVLWGLYVLEKARESWLVLLDCVEESVGGRSRL